jgi:hypothetical protein
VVRRRRRVAIVAGHDDALPETGLPVAHRAEDIEALAPALQKRLRDRHGHLVDELAVFGLAGVEARVLTQKALRHRARHGRAHRHAVVEEVALLLRVVTGLPVHVGVRVDRFVARLHPAAAGARQQQE